MKFKKSWRILHERLYKDLMNRETTKDNFVKIIKQKYLSHCIVSVTVPPTVRVK